MTKLDGSARGGCVVCLKTLRLYNFFERQLTCSTISDDTIIISQVSVVDELGIPVKFVGVGEGLEDLQPFDPEAFVDAIFS